VDPIGLVCIFVTLLTIQYTTIKHDNFYYHAWAMGCHNHQPSRKPICHPILESNRWLLRVEVLALNKVVPLFCQAYLAYWEIQARTRILYTWHIEKTEQNKEQKVGESLSCCIPFGLVGGMWKRRHTKLHSHASRQILYAFDSCDIQTFNSFQSNYPA
jgi:hypothetical protein